MSFSRSTSTLQKLQMFVASPESSQDFDPFDNNDSSVPMQTCEKLPTSAPQPLQERSKELELNTNESSSICIGEISCDANEVQCQIGKTGLSYRNQSYISRISHEGIKQIEQPVNQNWIEQVDQHFTANVECQNISVYHTSDRSPNCSSFHSTQSPIELPKDLTNSGLSDQNAVENINRIGSTSNSLEITCSNLQSGGDLQQPFNETAELRNFNDKVSFSSEGPRAMVDNSPGNYQMSNADAVIQMVTQASKDNSNAGGDRSNNQMSRQFPGPAGILPRLHSGLESEPRLANLMRLHKGSDLCKYAIEKEKSGYKHISPNAISTNYMSPHGGDNRCDRLEYIDDNELWKRMLDDEKLCCEGYHELMERFNVKFIKKSEDQLNEHNEDFKRAATYNSHVGYIVKTPLLIAAVKCIDFATDHQDPTCQLIDKTGTIYGQLSSEIIEQYGSRIQPGTVLVLKNLSVLSTIRNIYVNITLANMIALFWMSPSAGKGLTRTSGIFGKRICRVTKADILRDAKQMEDEARAEAVAQEASLKAEMQSSLCRTTASSGKISPTSSSSSLPSSIRTAIYNQQCPINYNWKNNLHQIHNSPQHPPFKPNFVPGVTSSPTAATSKPMNRPNSRFYGQPTGQQENTNALSLISQSDRPLGPKFVLKHLTNGSFNEKEKSEFHMLNPEKTDSKHAGDPNCNLLEGLDEESLFGEF